MYRFPYFCGLSAKNPMHLYEISGAEKISIFPLVSLLNFPMTYADFKSIGLFNTMTPPNAD